IAQVESSGLARFAGSEVHQPTLIENAVVTLRVVHDSRAGLATTNRVDADGLAELARRAAEAAESAPPDDKFPGLAPPAETAAVDPAAVTREAAEKAERTKGAREIDPGVYRAVLEPYAFAELLQYFSYDSLGALGLLEERSYFTGRLGQKVFDEKISIADDALDSRGFPKAFDFEGTPKQRVQLVEHGVARSVVWDRTTAAQAEDGTQSTGHAPPTESRDWGPLPYALSVAPGEAPAVEDLAQLVGDGLYITRLHYLGVVHPRDGVVTGMTRDGTFRIR